MIWTGWAICIGSLIAASYAKTAWQLILTQGLLYGIGFLILYYAVLSMLNEWFVKRRGLAYGCLFAAAGLSGGGLPFVTDYALQHLGFAYTLRIFALAMLVLIGPTLPFCRGRLPPIEYKRETHSIQWKLIFKNPIFYCFTISNVFQGFAFFLPFFYIVMYATTLSITPSLAVALFVTLNLSQVASQIAMGYLSDYANVFVLLVASNVGSIIACILWVTATGFNHLVIFAVLYGLFSGGYSVLVTRFVTALTADQPTGLSLYGVLAFQRGIGYVASGPLSAYLIKVMQDNSQGDFSEGLRKLIFFVGACLIAASLGGTGFFWREHALGPARSNKALRLEPRDSHSVRNSYG
jgi:MFS family permease